MYRWYANAAVCVAYLSGVSSHDQPANGDLSSEWFTRGWTLQELLAPALVLFCNREWQQIGHKCAHSSTFPLDIGCSPHGPKLNERIAQITGIDERYLERPSRIFDASVACRMSWASERRTTRTEDLAYCLLGLFEVNLALLYGEGQKSFRRLQEEIIRTSNDQSIFAWKHRDLRPMSTVAMLAQSPAEFREGGDIVLARDAPLGAPYLVTHNGLQLHAFVSEIEVPHLRMALTTLVLQLNCGRSMPLRDGVEYLPLEIAIACDAHGLGESGVTRQWFRIDAGYETDDTGRFRRSDRPLQSLYPPSTRRGARERLLYITAW